MLYNPVYLLSTSIPAPYTYIVIARGQKPKPGTSVWEADIRELWGGNDFEYKDI